MPFHEFALYQKPSEIITIWQECVGAEAEVRHNGSFLGAVPPEELSTKCAFTLSDGSLLTVQAVDQQVQVQHNGRRLVEVRPTAATHLQLLKRLLLLCASLDPVIGLIGFCILISEFSQDFAGFCWDACGSGSSSHLSALLSEAIFLVGWAMFPLIACIAGCLHALTTRHWKWIACGLGPLTFFELLLLSLVLSFFLGERPRLPLEAPSGLLVVGAVLMPLLVSLLCLVYAFRVGE